MSLYEGIADLGRDVDSGESKDKKGWEPAGLKLLQSQLQLKKATVPSSGKSKPSNPYSTATVSSSFNTELGHKKIQTGKFSSLMSSNGSLPFIHQLPKDTFFEDLNVEDEYNPLYPNDYERIVKRREEEKRQRKEEDRRKEAEEKLKRKRETVSRDSDDEWEESENNTSSNAKRETDKRTMGAAIAPPASLIEMGPKEEANSSDEPPGNETPSYVPSFGSGSKGLNVAAKIMEKYGYKQGAGLGKSEQGMSTALHVEKTGLRGGKIIHEKNLPPPLPVQKPVESGGQPELSLGESITDVLKNPTKVALLKNMVGPGEVDEDLEPEVKEEMAKYGEVVSVVLFELPGQPDDEAVRIFVEFAKVDQAIKAVVSLHGRYFGGRSIRAGFYEVDKFKRYDLND